ncbi:MAG: hypothetical protein H0W87_03950 [Actinobacteria bacterium]|nr:hypothetical protein [Actinomycetota bacterium]
MAHDVATSPDGARLCVTSTEDSLVRVLDSRTLQFRFSVMVGTPPQHVAFGLFSGTPAYLTSGYASRIELVNPLNGRIRRIASVPYGSFNLTTIGSNVVTSSLIRGTVTTLDGDLRLRRTVRVAHAARGIATVVWP